jgi:hypothetical protein
MRMRINRDRVFLPGVLVLALVAGVHALADAEPLPLPALGAGERGAYSARDARTGETLWQTAWRVRHAGENGHSVIQVEEDGQGRRGSDQETVWTLRLTVDLTGPAPRLSSIREIAEPSGGRLRTERREFDYQQGVGSVVTTDLATGGTQATTVELTQRSITPELLPALLRSLPAAARRQMRFEVIVGHEVVGMRAEIVGREHVQVPAGRFECYKVRLRLTGLKGFFARFVLPDLFLWQTVAAPHFWVKFEGAEGGPGSRVIVREVTAFEAGSQAS